MKIYALLTNVNCLTPISGDRVNEINTLKGLSRFAKVYYNNQRFNPDDEEHFGGNPKSSIEHPRSDCDLYYVRNNPTIFRNIRGKKIYFCLPNQQECFKRADALAYVTKTWMDFIDSPMAEWMFKGIYKKEDHIPKGKVLFNQITYPQNLKAHPKTKAIRESHDADFVIGHFGRVVRENNGAGFFSVLDKVLAPGTKVIYSGRILEPITEKRVIVLPAFPHSMMKHVISSVDALLYVQDYWGAFSGSLKVMEAMQYGVPILSPRYQARIEELGTDYELYYSSPAEMAEKIVWLRENPAEAKKIGKRMIKRAEYYNLENSAKRFHEQLIKLL